jgi:hypothetical protein
VHLGVAERLARPRLLVLKGGGGEAERVPLKPAVASVWDLTLGRQELALPAIEGLRPHPPAGDTLAGLPRSGPGRQRPRRRWRRSRRRSRWRCWRSGVQTIRRRR